MPVLSDRDLVARRDRGGLSIEPFDPESLTPNGYDVSVAEVVVPGTGERIASGVARIPAGSRFAVATREVLSLGADLTASIWLRTSWVRKGIVATFGKVDAGFRGTLTLGAFNASENPVDLPIGDRFAQVVFEELTSPSEKPYGERGGRYQDQRGVRLS